MGKFECVIVDAKLGFFDYTFETGLSNSTHEVVVKNDSLINNNDVIFNRETKVIKDETVGKLVEYSPEENVLTINYARDKEKHRTIQTIKSFLSSFRAFDDSLKMSNRRYNDDNDIVDGSNTELLIIELLNLYKDAYASFLSNLTEILPSIKNITIHKIELSSERTLERVYIDEEGVGEYYFQSASAGYKKVLVILALLFHPRETSLIILDEVEDGLDYDVLKKTVDLLQRMGSRKQIIATTHSPNLANTVDLENWHVAKRVSRGVRFFRVKRDEKLMELKRLGMPNYDLFVQELLTLDEENE